jgi:hypothetical protein
MAIGAENKSVSPRAANASSAVAPSRSPKIFDTGRPVRNEVPRSSLARRPT